MPQMWIPVNRRPTYIQPYKRRFQRNKLLLAPSQRIVNKKFRIHIYTIIRCKSTNFPSMFRLFWQILRYFLTFVYILNGVNITLY